MAWWLWAIFGFLLIYLELSTSSFVFVFFGSSALVMAVLTGLGLGGPAWFQFLLFSALSLISAALLRRKLIQKFRVGRSASDMDDLSGQDAIADEEIAPDTQGQVHMRGTTWKARNLGPGPVLEGQRCRVERVVGIGLEVRPLSAEAVQQDILR